MVASGDAANGGNIFPTGTARFDNFIIAGQVPEPTTLASLALGAAVALLRRRARAA